MSSSQPWVALAIGDGSRAEFRAVLASLRACSQVESAATVDAALGASLSPDMVVLFESRPDDFAQAEVERLRSTWPLAGLVCVLGSWCEAEGRSGRPLAGTWRVAWHQWSPRFEVEWVCWQAGRCPAWGLPATTLEEERIQHAPARQASRNACLAEEGGTIAIRTTQRELTGLLVDVCRATGRKGVWLTEDKLPEACKIEAVLYDLALPMTPADMAASFLTWLPRPIIALADYPRSEDVEAALAAGATALLSKPLVVEELIWQIERQALATALPEWVIRPLVDATLSGGHNLPWKFVFPRSRHSADMQLKLLSDDDSVALVRVSGRIAPDSFSRDNEPLAKLLGPGVYHRRVLMSLEDSDYINSSGVGWLLICHKRFRESGGRLVIHSIPKLICEVFDVLRMNQVFNLAPDAAGARRMALKDPD